MAGRSPLQRSLGIGGHHRPHRGQTDDWLTPPHIIEALGPFNTDPCCPPNMPWRTATTMLTEADDGLTTDWEGFVWLNPPYGPAVGDWLARLADHPAGGIALIFARTETVAFQQYAFGSASSMLFLAGRLHFHYPNGDRAKANAGAPSVLVAYGGVADLALYRAVALGALAGAIWEPQRTAGRAA